MRKVVMLVTAVVAVLAIVGFASVRAIDADGAPSSAIPVVTAKSAVTTGAEVATATKTYYLTAGGLKRSYEVIAPVTALPKSAPVIVMLSGIYSTVAQEISRDRLVNYASADKAEIVYPVAFDESWNAIGCCGKAAADNVNDLAFLKALVAKVNPKNARHIYLVGYSNGARMAYRVACDDPSLFDEYGMVKALPTADCRISKPVSIVAMASLNDPEVSYNPGVTTQVAQLHATEKCPAKSTTLHSGQMTLTTWSGCADGTRLALAAWSGGVHSFPRPPASVPAAAQVLWSFFTKTPLASLPA
jgi:polyhydroxybutyrate depolymerase